MASVYRVFREGNVIRVFRLSKPDATGNQHWVVVATLKANDLVQVNGRLVKAADLDDQALVQAITGENNG